MAATGFHLVRKGDARLWKDKGRIRKVFSTSCGVPLQGRTARWSSAAGEVARMRRTRTRASCPPARSGDRSPSQDFPKIPMLGDRGVLESN